MKGKLKYIVIPFLIYIIHSCNYEFPSNELDYSSGSIDFSKFVSLGSSVTAGYMDGALYTNGQQNSYPAIIANQINLFETINFNQPDINSENGYNKSESTQTEIKGRYIYKFPENNSPNPIIETLDGELPDSYENDIIELNNWAIPGIKTFDFITTEFDDNLYYNRLTQIDNTKNLLQNLEQVNATFFTLFYGLNDLLDYAIAGGTGVSDMTMEPTNHNNITPVELFEAILNDILSNMGDAKGILTTIPDVSDFAYFITVPYRYLTFFISDYQPDDLDANYAHYFNFNKAIELHNSASPDELKRPQILFTGDPGMERVPLIIEDNNLPDAFYPDGTPLPKIRMSTENDRILLNVRKENISPLGYGYIIPVSENYVLTQSEIEVLRENNSKYNNAIKNAVSNSNGNYGLLDLNTILSNLYLSTLVDEFGQHIYSEEQIVFEGVPLPYDMDLYGMFSLDGINPNQRGSAYFANLIIEAINYSFEANIPKTNINHFAGNNYSD